MYNIVHVRQTIMVASESTWKTEIGKLGWGWRRSFFFLSFGEEHFEECIALLDNFVLLDNVANKWNKEYNSEMAIW